MPDASEPPQRTTILSLTGATIRRTMVIGRLYLGIGVGVSVLLALILALGAHGGAEFGQVFPLEDPLFAVMGSTGGLLTFTSDRTKGVFEYLIAYGVPPRTLFLNGLIATATMTAIILGCSMLVGFGVAAGFGVGVNSAVVAKTVVLYTLPMSFAAALFTATVGMIWASISSPRTGMNSPLGLAPLVGIAPTVLVLIVAETVPPADFYYVTAGAATAIVAAVVVLLLLSARLMGRERFLSPL